MPEKIEMFMLKKDKTTAELITEEIFAAPPPEKGMKKRIYKILRSQKAHKILLGLFIIGLIALSLYYYHQYKKVTDNPDVVAQEEMKAVNAQVAKIMELPQGEDPTVATVSDKDKLKDQEFFKNAENGDKILVYTGAREAILYRPGANKIINVAPLVMDQNDGSNQTSPNNNQPAPQNSPSPDQAAQTNTPPASPATDNTPLVSPTAPDNNQPADQNAPAPSTANSSDNTPEVSLNVVIDNGSKTVGLAKDIETKLSGISGISVTGTGDAKKNNYTGTLVVDLTQKNTDLVNQIAQAVGGQVGSLPAGETKPDNADVLIIAGK